MDVEMLEIHFVSGIIYGVLVGYICLFIFHLNQSLLRGTI